MTSVIVSSPFVAPGNKLKRLMLHVIVALLPGTVAYAWLFGPGVIVNIILAIVFALVFEGAILRLRAKPVMPHLTDFSAVVAAWLFALCLPMHAPWWLVGVGMGFAMIAGKHLYGGLGFNPFNPAMVGYVVLLISFPREMTTWYLPLSLSDTTLSLADTLAYSFGGADIGQWDALSTATPLDQIRTGLGQNIPLDEIRQSPLFGAYGGAGWEWIALCWFVGGIYLLATGTIRWHIPVSLLAGVLTLSLIFYLLDPQHYAAPLFHLMSGAVVIGAFFIATDPVSAATTDMGRIYYGLMIGMLIYVIRVWGGYPDGVAFAVLLANMCVPLIDYYTQPRVYGEQ
ncbi:MAG: electron transport complex subunit RsxD [Gammaproteobacteria bacterium]|nr:electron transport complex subunit RsxD [Gammaproteobacteria bacterium]MDH3447913.1 electron transport complex subunit RsxD [Gammaproteobacteria bacterium]